MILRYFCH